MKKTKKCNKVCSTCVYGVLCKSTNCRVCKNLDNTGAVPVCKCTKVKKGKVCEYYEEFKKGYDI